MRQALVQRICIHLISCLISLSCTSYSVEPWLSLSVFFYFLPCVCVCIPGLSLYGGHGALSDSLKLFSPKVLELLCKVKWVNKTFVLNFNPISVTNVGGGVCQYLSEEIEETTNAKFFSFSHGFPGRVQLTLVISWTFNYNVTFIRQTEKQWICKTTLVQCCCAVLALLNWSNYSLFKDLTARVLFTDF